MNTAQKIETAQHRLNDVLRLTHEASVELKDMQQKRKRINTTLTQKQAGRMLGVSARTVARMLEDGRLESLAFEEVFNYQK